LLDDHPAPAGARIHVGYGLWPSCRPARRHLRTPRGVGDHL